MNILAMIAYLTKFRLSKVPKVPGFPQKTLYIDKGVCGSVNAYRQEIYIHTPPYIGKSVGTWELGNQQA